MFAAEWRWHGVWNSFPFLAWDLSMQPRTQICFFNQLICTGACAWSLNLNYAHKCIENSVNASKCPHEPQKITKIHTTLLLFYVDTRKKMKAIRGHGIVSSPKVGRSLPKTIMLVVRSSSLWEAYTQTCPKWDKIFTTACWCRSMIACQVSWISDEFWIY